MKRLFIFLIILLCSTTTIFANFSNFGFFGQADTEPSIEYLVQYLMETNDSVATVTIDESGNGNTGEVHTAVFSYNAKNSWYEFALDFILTPFGVGYNVYSNALRLSVWAKTDNTGTFQVLYHTGNGSNQRYYIAKNAPQTVSLYTGAATGSAVITTTNTMIVGVWHHFMGGSHGDGTTSLYMDGIFQGEGTVANFALAKDIEIGRTVDSANYWDGGIDDFELTANTSLDANTIFQEGWVAHGQYEGIQNAPGWTNMIINLTFDAQSSQNFIEVAGIGIGIDTDMVYSSVDMNAELNGASSFIGFSDADIYSFTNVASDLPFSFSMEINADTLVGVDGLIGKFSLNDAEYLAFLDAGKLTVRCYNKTAAAGFIGRTYSVALSTGVDYVVTMTYDGSRTSAGWNIYLDGVDVDDGDSEGGSYTGMENGALDMRIGEYGGLFDGIIDNVRMWRNIELSPEEVLELYNYFK